METCIGCGGATCEFEIVNLYRILGTNVQNEIFSETTTTNYETASLQVPYCSECKKRLGRYSTILLISSLSCIGGIYYIWHLYFPNFFDIDGFFFGLAIIIAYLAVISTLFYFFDKISKAITGHKKSPSDHPEIQKMISEDWKEGTTP